MEEIATDWMSVPDAAKLKGVAESSLRYAINKGHVYGQKIGRGYIVSRRSLIDWRPGKQGPKRRRPAEAA